MATMTGSPVDARVRALEPLYPKLQPRWCGLSREEVAGNQRVRLLGAMVEVVTERGLAGASIKRVSALAGVSRQTFYDLFDSREECFLEAYDEIVEHTRRYVDTARHIDGDRQTKLQAALDAYVAVVTARPKAARLALIGAFDAGPAARARTQSSRRKFEETIAASLAPPLDGIEIEPVIVTGIACGIESITRRSLAGDVGELPAHAHELAAWMLSYSSPAAMQLSDLALASRWAPVRPAQRAPVADPRNERLRALRATAQIAADVGYSQLTSGQIADAAGISQKTLKALYGSVEQCFQAAFGLLTVEALSRAERASQDGDPRAGVHRAMVALMRHVASDQVFMRVAFGEVFAAGADTVAHRDRMLHKFGELLLKGLPESQRGSSLRTEASVGAVWDFVQHHVTGGSARLLPSLAGHATYLALAPTIGPNEAVQAIIDGSTQSVQYAQS
ncbi:MAG TPA: TetR/AcrR family transcriptional regulator [Solirubrobacteraceae bacterium]|jgi:AcrR family transcriptional regulator